MDTKQILLDAAKHIERYGWIQCSMIDDASSHSLLHGATCAVGAVKVVALQPAYYGAIQWFLSDDNTAPAFDALSRVLELPPILEGDASLAEIIEWNDDNDRTSEEVVAALRLAASSVTE